MFAVHIATVLLPWHYYIHLYSPESYSNMKQT